MQQRKKWQYHIIKKWQEREQRMQEQTNTGLFLSKDEMRELTGRSYPTLQIKVLKKNRIPFYTNYKGEPRVAREALFGRKTEPKTSQPTEWVSNVLKQT